jgi:hypothetical protein
MEKTPDDQGFVGAGDETRTRDLHLGKVTLYQLSHARKKGHITRWSMDKSRNDSWTRGDQAGQMKPMRPPRLAWIAFAVTTLMLIGGFALSALNAAGASDTEIREVIVGDALWVGMFTFSLVGVLVASRQPQNPIGWILLAVGFIWQLTGALGENYVLYGLETSPGAVPGADVVAVIATEGWIPGIGLIGTFLLLLFPNGHLPSPRWRPLAWLSGVALGLPMIAVPLTPGPLTEAGYPEIENPLGVDALDGLDLLAPLVLLIPLCVIACAVSLVVRFRRSSGQERLQLKWLTTAGAITAALYLATMILSIPYEWGSGAPLWVSVFQYISVFSFILIPIAVGIAILRHRLFDIDIIINRALVYSAITVTLASIYVATVVLIGGIAREVMSQKDNNLAVAASTLVVASLFGPVRRRVQSLIDSRFYRRKYNGQQTLAAFGERLRDEVDLNSLNRELVTVVSTTMQPDQVSLWLKPRPRD